MCISGRIYGSNGEKIRLHPVNKANLNEPRMQKLQDKALCKSFCILLIKLHAFMSISFLKIVKSFIENKMTHPPRACT